MVEKMKICKTCKKELPSNYFYDRRERKNLLRTECKKCHTENILGTRRERLEILKVNGCSICGYEKCNSALEFHHINPEEKEFRIALPNMGKGYKTILNEMQKCMLLCANCHREIHANGSEKK